MTVYSLYAVQVSDDMKRHLRTLKNRESAYLSRQKKQQVHLLWYIVCFMNHYILWIWNCGCSVIIVLTSTFPLNGFDAFHTWITLLHQSRSFAICLQCLMTKLLTLSNINACWRMYFISIKYFKILYNNYYSIGIFCSWCENLFEFHNNYTLSWRCCSLTICGYSMQDTSSETRY